MTTNRAVPVSGVLPEIYYKNADEAVQWLARTYGFEQHYRVPEDDGRVHTAQLRLGDAYVMVRYEREGQASPATAGTSTQSLMVIVDDVDAHFARARDNGATIVSEPEDQVYGEREYKTIDLDCHVWIFSQHITDIDPSAMFG